MASSDDIVDLVSDGSHVGLSVKAPPHFFVGLDETFKFLLKAVVLIVKVGHVLVEGVHLSLQLDLVSSHLV